MLYKKWAWSVPTVEVILTLENLLGPSKTQTPLTICNLRPEKENHWHSRPRLIPPNSSFLLFPLQKLPAKSQVQWSLTPRHFRSPTTLSTFQSNSSEKYHPQIILNYLIYVKQKKKKRKVKIQERNPTSGKEQSENKTIYLFFIFKKWLEDIFFFFLFL